MPTVSRITVLGLSVLALLINTVPVSALPPAGEADSTRVNLHTGWQLQSACVLSGATTPAGLKADAPVVSGAQISSPTYHPSGWIPANVPATVVAAQVAAGIIKDPFFGKNMLNLPGMDFPVGGLFSNLSMLDTSPYNCGWWYRTEFRVPSTFAGKQIALHLDGVNYRADVWLNGKQVAGRSDLAGTWRSFELNVSDALLGGRPNILAIEVFPQTEEDLGITWVDWNPSPPDKNTGLFRDVYLTASGSVALRFPYVASKLDADFSTAHLTLMVEARNTSSKPVAATVTWEIDGKRIHQEVSLAAVETKTLSFSPDQFPELTIKNPQLWWPAQLGEPHLYQARVSASEGTTMSDSHNVTYGIREVTSQIDAPANRRLFKINGVPIVIRGGGWAPDMLLRSDPKRMETQFRYVRDMGLNTIRLEGKLEDPAFYELADRMGIMIMPGWCCCDMWERWNDWGPEQWKTAEAAQRDQARLLRTHPSVFVWLYGSDNPPPVDVEKMYLRVLQEEHWPNPTVSSASATPTLVTGPSGVKMTGPYDYVPPNYWLLGTKDGGAEGFNTETSPGPAIPTPESLRRFLPEDKLWPQNDYWGYHAGGERFQTINFYNTSLEHRYGAPKDLNDFVRKAYAMDYEGERAMFESFVRNKYNSTGVVQWMLNNAWPSIIWHLYDYYLVPAGGYYGTKKANEPVHALYSYSDNMAVVVSENGKPQNGLTVSAKVYDIDANEKWSQQAKLNVTPGAAATAFAISPPSGISTTYFLKLTATDAAGKLLSDNFYWLSTRPDELDWAKTTGVNTPQSGYADMTSLQTLPSVVVRAGVEPVVKGSDGFQERALNLQNTGKSVAFMVHLRLTNADGQDAVAFWDDNFVTLLPGESRHIKLRYQADDVPGHANVILDGWNVDAQSIALR